MKDLIEKLDMELKIVHPEITADYIENAHRFLIESHIKPQFSKALLNRFFTELSSTPQNVIEVWDGNEKVAGAVLVDKITNPHHSASIELLGFHNLEHPKEVLAKISAHFEKITKHREVHLALMIGYHPSFPFSADVIRSLGYVSYFETYDLISKKQFAIKKNQSDEFTISRLDIKNFEEYYEVLCRSFADNPDTSIGPMEIMKEGFKKNPLPIFVAKNSRLIGFIALIIDGEVGEVNTLGVLPEFRKSGIGKNLLATGVEHLWEQKVKSVKLNVAIQNKKALDLYLNSGFEVSDSFLTLRKIL